MKKTKYLKLNLLVVFCLVLFYTQMTFSKNGSLSDKQPSAIIISDSIYLGQLNAIAPLLENDYGLKSFEFSKKSLSFFDQDWRDFIEEKITEDQVQLLIISMGLQSFYSVKSNQLLLFSLTPQDNFFQRVSKLSLYPRFLIMDFTRWLGGLFYTDRKKNINNESLKDNNSFIKNLEVAMTLQNDSEFSIYKQLIVLRFKGPLALLKNIRDGKVHESRNRSFLRSIAYNILKDPQKSFEEIQNISFDNRYLRMISQYLSLQLKDRKDLCMQFNNIDTIAGKSYIELQIDAICSDNRSSENQKAYEELSVENKTNPIHTMDPIYYLWPDTTVTSKDFIKRNINIYKNSQGGSRQWAASRLYLFIHHKKLEVSYHDRLQQIDKDVNPILTKFIKYKYGYKNLIALRNALLRSTSLPYRNITLSRMSDIHLDMSYINYICSNVKRILILGYPSAKSDLHYKVKNYCQNIAIFEPSDAQGFSYDYLSDGIHYSKRGMTWLNAHIKNILKECYLSDHWSQCALDHSGSK